MHIPDGYLGPTTYGSLWAATVAAWYCASRKVKEGLSVSQVPFLATSSAFSFLVMIFIIPLPGGTSGHIAGATLIAILLGPWAATMAVSIALIIQALLFGEGGITAIGANCFNIAFAGSFVGYGAYALILRVAAVFRGGTNRNTVPLPTRLAGAGVGAYLGMNAAALLTAVELGIQPLLYPAGSGTAGYFPFPLSIAIPAVMIPHLTAVGLLESVVSVLVLLFLHKYQPKMAEGWSMSKTTLFALFFTILIPAANAHEFWVEKKGSDYTLVYGHGSNREDFDASRVSGASAFDAAGKAIEVQREKREKGVLLKIPGNPSVVSVEVDNGYWSKTIYGWKNQPKRKASRVVEAIRSYNYSKALIAWSETAQNLPGDPKLDIIPMKNPFDLKSGESLPLRVVHQGKPVPDAEVEGTDHRKVATTDKDGFTQVRISKGYQVITVTHKVPLKGDPDADFLSMTMTLTFEVKK